MTTTFAQRGVLTGIFALASGYQLGVFEFLSGPGGGCSFFILLRYPTFALYKVLYSITFAWSRLGRDGMDIAPRNGVEGIQVRWRGLGGLVRECRRLIVWKGAGRNGCAEHHVYINGGVVMDNNHAAKGQQYFKNKLVFTLWFDALHSLTGS